MFVFPEGTRSKTGEMAPFHEASMKIATKTGAPIIPVAFTNTREIFETHLPRMKKTKVIVTYMPPVYPYQLEGENKKKVGAYIQSLIQKQLDEDAKLI
jgi:1-acyl-sn-glycerol-3-phosphate acyltransferase